MDVAYGLLGYGGYWHTELLDIISNVHFNLEDMFFKIDYSVLVISIKIKSLCKHTNKLFIFT